MTYITNHGGGCCGIDHIINFGNSPTEVSVKEFETRVKNFKRNYASRVLEATLKDSQMVGWAPHLKKAGFQIVNRFVNSNSGNAVNVLHLCSRKPRSLRYRVPEPTYKW